MERLTEKSSSYFEYDLVNGNHLAKVFEDFDSYLNYNLAIGKLGEYEDAEEDGLLMLKVWILESACSKPNDCDGDCEFCDGNELDTKEILIKYSDFDKTKHYKSEAEAEQALAKMKGE